MLITGIESIIDCFYYLQVGKGRNLKLPQLIDMAAQIAAGMAYLGMCQICQSISWFAVAQLISTLFWFQNPKIISIVIWQPVTC